MPFPQFRRGAQATRGLRFRLTLSYVLFFTIVLFILGFFFRETLRASYAAENRTLLEQEWGAVKAYLRIEKGKVDWFYDPEDPDEAIIVDRLKQIYLLTDSKGNAIQISPKYKELGVESPSEIANALRSQKPVWSFRKDQEGVPHMLRSGLFVDDDRKSFYVAIGRSMAQSNRILDDFTMTYAVMLPVMILSSSFLGWFLAGRALRPLNDLARTAQRITGANLNAEIPSRRADDELDRLIGAFNRMVKRLDNSFTQTRQFSADVSHELRTPLTVIRGQLEVALFAAETVEQYREAIADALEAVERLSQTIRALLLLSQAESGHLVLQKQSIDLAALAADHVENFHLAAEEAQLQLSFTGPEACLLAADKVQMDRLVSNLLSNALKYTHPGGSVQVIVTCSQGKAALVVEDTGTGISADHLPHIFDRFYRVPKVDAIQAAGCESGHGLGLGLSFVSWIVRAHEGRIDVQSTVGIGTRFTVELPLGQLPVQVPAHDLETSAAPVGRTVE